MKLIIDISKEMYNNINKIQNGSIGAKQILNAVKNGTPIPDNATNGDMPCITPEEMQKCKDTVKKYTPKQEPSETIHGSTYGVVSWGGMHEPQESCGDAVSREDAIRQLRTDTLFVCIGDKMQAISDIEGLPPVTPQQKIGHWINNQNGTFTCDICGCNHSKSNYCPNCGARMVEPTCGTCEYTTATFNPCNACKDKSEYEPQESEVRNDTDSNW